MRRKAVAIPLIVLVFLLVSATTLYVSARQISDEFLEVLGEGIADFSSHLAGQLALTDADVAALKGMTFEEAARSEANVELSREVLAAEYGQSIRGAYLYCPLGEDEVRYHVDESNAAFYGLPLGTPLDVMWLLDVGVKADETSATLHAAGTYYDDMYRYSHMRAAERAIVEARAVTHAFVDDEWGRMIAGYAPVYTVEGTFVGMLGVDMFAEELLEHKAVAVWRIIMTYAVTTLTLCLLFAWVYVKYLRVRREQLYVDPLTSAYNRRYFNELFASNLSVHKNADRLLALLMLDIDHFKSVNDTYGHEKGDECLRAIAQAATKALKMPPNVLMRYGGEEFLAAITVDTEAQANEMIEAILENVRSLDLFGDGKRVTVSGGAAVLRYRDVEKTDMHFVVKAADDNLYYAKNNGRNRYKITSYAGEK